jgi:hypothetical protein
MMEKSKEYSLLYGGNPADYNINFNPQFSQRDRNGNPIKYTTATMR